MRKVLVANRGEIARRVMRTCRRLGIGTVAVYSEADRNALHVRDADEAVCVGPAPAKESYLSIERVLEAARRTGADAVHPGYGFLSEKSAFARALGDAGIRFIGPPPDVLDAFGDKMKARAVALAAGTQPVPGSDGPVGVEQAQGVAGTIGYPILVKAVGGGGGIGMQLAPDEAALERAARACADRARAAFADERIYLERYMTAPRHIEVQVFADTHGQVFALGERECSLQRRHQKIVEESPSPAHFFEGAEGAARQRELFEAALRVVRHVGYVGAGTCEFIANAAGELFFLEVNARLQVEHPVTEMVTGLDLVELQLLVADGQRLGNLSDVRRRGHAIEARIYAEDPAKGFVPKPGRVEEIHWAGGQGEVQSERLRVESAVGPGSEVTPFYDPMVAKVVAWGEDRPSAIQELHDALSSTRIAPLVTNIPFLCAVLRGPDFAAGAYDTHYAEPFAKAWAKGAPIPTA